MKDGIDAIVLGSLNVDFVVHAHKRPSKGETVTGESFHLFPGGKGANQAVAASKLGLSVAMAGRIGQDVFSEILLDSLSGAGVRSQFIFTAESVSTGSAFITIDRQGDNSIIAVPGANGLCSRGDVDRIEPYFKEAKVLMLQMEIPIETVTYAAEVAHRHGVRVILDPAPPAPLDDSLLKILDVITPNEHEASFLTGRKVFDRASATLAASDFLEKGVRAAVVKLGAQGLAYCDAASSGFIEGHKVKTVDTTAAGDTFSGALAVALCEGQSLFSACKFANAAAALSVTRHGAQDSMPDRAEVCAFLDNYC